MMGPPGEGVAATHHMLTEQRQLDALGSLLITSGVLMVQVIPRWGDTDSWETAVWRGMGLLSVALSLSAFALPGVYRRHRGVMALAFRAVTAALPHGVVPKLRLAGSLPADAFNVVLGTGILRMISTGFFVPLPLFQHVVVCLVHLWSAANVPGRCAMCESELLRAYEPAIGKVHEFMDEFTAFSGQTASAETAQHRCMVFVVFLFCVAAVLLTRGLVALAPPVLGHGTGVHRLPPACREFARELRGALRRDISVKIVCWYAAFSMSWIFAKLTLRRATACPA